MRWSILPFTPRRLAVVAALCILGAGAAMFVAGPEFFIRVLWKTTRMASIALRSEDPQFLFDAGTYHLNATRARGYDLTNAEQLLRKAVASDPSLLYGFHQLARIAFLREDYSTARTYIDTQISYHGSSTPGSFYVRGLIKGFSKDYVSAAEDFERYLESDPTNWAAVNDLAWVLLKAERPQEALDAIDTVLSLWSKNPWLLNSYATALYELGRVDEAHTVVLKAARLVGKVTESQWSTAYPGNDPLIAAQGVAQFQQAVLENLRTISAAVRKDTEKKSQ